MPSSFFNDDAETQKPPNEVLPPEEAPKPGNDFKTDEGRLGAVMSYIPFLCFVPLLNMRHNEEARFHAKQGVMLFLIEALAVLFLFDRISDFVFTTILIAAVAFSIAGIFFAMQGRNFRLPIISDLAERTKL